MALQLRLQVLLKYLFRSVFRLGRRNYVSQDTCRTVRSTLCCLHSTTQCHTCRLPSPTHSTAITSSASSVASRGRTRTTTCILLEALDVPDDGFGVFRRRFILLRRLRVNPDFVYYLNWISRLLKISFLFEYITFIILLRCRHGHCRLGMSLNLTMTPSLDTVKNKRCYRVDVAQNRNKG